MAPFSAVTVLYGYNGFIEGGFFYFPWIDLVIRKIVSE